MEKTETESNILPGSVINSAQSSGKKIIRDVKACPVFCASLFKEKVFHVNGLILKFSLLQYCAYLTRLSFFFSRT